ncbi:MAG: 30S ribosomal protein S6 [Desulfomonilaceae bacterium]
MRRYEALIVLDPDMADDEVKALTERFSGTIKDHSGEIIKIEDWGTKKLAYLVRKKDKGRYILFDFVSGPELINELERQFKITEDVMKYLSVKLDDEVDLDAFKAKAQKEAVEAEAMMVAAVEPPTTEEIEAPKDEITAEEQNGVGAEDVPEAPAAVSSTEEEGE